MRASTRMRSSLRVVVVVEKEDREVSHHCLHHRSLQRLLFRHLVVTETDGAWGALRDGVREQTRPHRGLGPPAAASTFVRDNAPPATVHPNGDVVDVVAQGYCCSSCGSVVGFAPLQAGDVPDAAGASLRYSSPLASSRAPSRHLPTRQEAQSTRPSHSTRRSPLPNAISGKEESPRREDGDDDEDENVRRRPSLHPRRSRTPAAS